MIYDRLDRIAVYRTLSPRLTRAIEYAQGARADLSLGRHEIDDDGLFAVVHEYATKPAAAAKWEAHRRYIDLQLMLMGSERMDVADVGSLNGSGPFDVDQDVGFFEPPAAFQSVVVSAGAFAVFFPHDAHRPTVCIDVAKTVRKVVVKIRID